jgi:hypothetical protein
MGKIKIYISLNQTIHNLQTVTSLVNKKLCTYKKLKCMILEHQNDKKVFNCSRTQTVLRLKTCSSACGEGFVYVYNVKSIISIISGTVVLAIRQIQKAVNSLG